jgi:hypothetical protein
MTKKAMNKAQEIHFRRLELCDYIGGDCRTQGKTVANDLRKHSDLWDSFVFGRFDWGQLVELRDLPGGHLNADTLFIKTTVDRAEALRALILSWKPDEYVATEAESSSSCSSEYTRHVANMMGMSQLREGVVVFEAWWD